MRKATIIFAFAIFLPFLISAQYNEAGIFIGTSNYSGDLQSKLEPTEYNVAFGLFARRHFSKYLAAKAHFYKGELSGSDEHQTFKSGLQERNLSFRTSIMELGVQGELNFTPYAIREKKFSTGYLFLGVSGIYFNPQAQMGGDWYDLQPLGTEGQTIDPDMKKYSKVNVAVPFGFGIRLNINEQTNFGFEIGVRKTFTDYLDDVSTYYPDIDALAAHDPIAAVLSFRSPDYLNKPLPNPVGTERGDATNKDWYVFAGVSVSVNLINDKYDLEWEEKYKKFKDQNFDFYNNNDEYKYH